VARALAADSAVWPPKDPRISSDGRALAINVGTAIILIPTIMPSIFASRSFWDSPVQRKRQFSTATSFRAVKASVVLVAPFSLMAWWSFWATS